MEKRIEVRQTSLPSECTEGYKNARVRRLQGGGNEVVRTEETLTKLQPPQGCLVLDVPATTAPTCIGAHNPRHVVRAEQPGTTTAAQSPPGLPPDGMASSVRVHLSVNCNSSPPHVLTVCPHPTSALAKPWWKLCSANHTYPQNFCAILSSTTFPSTRAVNSKSLSNPTNPLGAL